MTAPPTVTLHSLSGRHDVPAAALVHRNPFLGLLAEIHRLLAAAAATFDHRAQEVCCPWTVAVRVASVAVVTAVVHVALRMERQRFIIHSFQCKM